MKRNDTPQDVWEKLKADADANAFSAVTTEGGKDLSRFIRESIALKKDLQKAEAAAKAVRVERDRLLYDLIPALMTEMGIERVEVDGHTVALYSFGSGTMPKDPAENAAALAHLREIGAGDFIKHDVSVSFAVKEDNAASALRADLEAQGFSVASKTWVESSTLRKLIKDQKGIDLDIFNGYVGTRAQITGAK